LVVGSAIVCQTLLYLRVACSNWQRADDVTQPKFDIREVTISNTVALIDHKYQVELDGVANLKINHDTMIKNGG